MDRKQGNFRPQHPGTKRLNHPDVVGTMAASICQNSMFKNFTDFEKISKRSTKNSKWLKCRIISGLKISKPRSLFQLLSALSAIGLFILWKSLEAFIFHNSELITWHYPLNEHDAMVMAKAFGYQIGGAGLSFGGDWRAKGLYAYSSGKFSGMAFFGRGGCPDQQTRALSDKEKKKGMFRPWE